MTDETTVIEEAKELVKAATTPTTFNFAEAVLNRSYPEFDVIVYLDEKNIQRFMDIHDERFVLEERILASKSPKAGTTISAARVKQAEQLAELDKAYNDIQDELAPSKYTIKIRGISPETNVALENKANEAFPIEYEESTNPLTGAPVKTPIENDKRTEFYANLIRQAHFVSVTAPNGAVDEDFSDVGKVQKIITNLPFLAQQRVDSAINKATITADFYRVLVDPVF